MVENREIANVLDDLGNLLEIDGEGPFRIRAYRNAADSIRFFDPPIERMVAEGRDLTELDDVGSGIAARIEEIVARGADAFRRELEAKHGPGLLELLRIPGLGPKKVRALRDGLGVGSLDDLVAALDDGRILEVPGFGAKTAETLRRRVARLRGEGEGRPGVEPG